MLCNVRHHGGLNKGSLGVLADQLRNRRVLHHRHVDADVRFLILI